MAIDYLVESELQARGIAQVIAILKPAGSPLTNADNALAAAMPVASSKTRVVPEKLVLELSKHFHISEVGQDTALAMSLAKQKIKSAGENWYRKAASTADPTPPVRYFPNLGVLLGTVDKTGLNALRNHRQVEQVVGAPQLSLIRPVEVRPAKSQAPAATNAAAATWGIKRLKADQLHNQNIDGRGVVVGHLDTGADGAHAALKTAFHSFAEFDLMGFQVTPAPKPHDTDEHGTHTAGTIAGRTVSGRAIGVAPGATLASAIVIEGGKVIARVLAGMEWIVGEGATILSMSLGLRGFVDDFLPLTQVLRQRGVLPVFAVGNEGPGTSRSPGNYDEALSVGAMDENDEVADFSSSQQFSGWRVPDLVAPGVGVISAKPGGGYQEMDGSSMATPHIAGLAALLKQAEPSATIDQIEQAIFGSCAQLSGVPALRQGKGVPDAVRALDILRSAGARAVEGRLLAPTHAGVDVVDGAPEPRRKVSTRKTTKSKPKQTKARRNRRVKHRT